MLYRLNINFCMFQSGDWNFGFIQSGILKRIGEKENERDSFELQISNVNLSHIDERENYMVNFPS